MIALILNMNWVGLAVIGLIVLIFIGALISLVKIKRRYRQLVQDIEEETHRKKQYFEYAINNSLVKDFKYAINQRINEVNTAAVVDKHLNAYLYKTHMAERFVAKAPGMMIVLGIVGTFFGLTLSIAELVQLLESPDMIMGEVSNITGGLMDAINGMAIAFITSLFGIVSSIFFNILFVFVGPEESKNHYVCSAEEYLDNHLGHRSTDLTFIDERGRTPLEIAFEELGERLSSELQSVSESMSYKLTVASKSMEETSISLEKGLKSFDDSIDKFSKNTGDFMEFNHQLKNNIQRMSLAFDDFAQELKKNRQV